MKDPQTLSFDGMVSAFYHLLNRFGYSLCSNTPHDTCTLESALQGVCTSRQAHT